MEEMLEVWAGCYQPCSGWLWAELESIPGSTPSLPRFLSTACCPISYLTSGTALLLLSSMKHLEDALFCGTRLCREMACS